MKTYPLVLLAILISFGLQSCMKDKCEREITYVKSTPIYKQVEEIRSGIDFLGPRELVNPGKIYFYNDYIFINEQNEGVHIVDNSNPSAPNSIGFLAIPGNVDIAISDQILYADNYIDLLTIDIKNILQPSILKRSENIFPHYGQQNDGSYLVGFDYEEVTEMVDCESNARGGGWSNGAFAPFAEASLDLNQAEGGAGVGGSLARFTITDGHLYTIDQYDLKVFDLSQNNCPNQVSTVNLGWDIETIFPYDNKLFIGSNTGMTIYDISSPASPVYLSGYSHWTSCDPVYVKDNYAYVTLRSGTLCNGSTINQLDLLDISDITNPILVSSFPMDNPHGLSIKDNSLFLCEGDYGLKVFDIAQPLNLDKNQIAHQTGREAKDVIVVPGDENILLVIGSDGFYQYDFDNPQELKELSFIPVVGTP